MSISFSGLGSGLDTSSWVEALVSVKQQEVVKLQTNLKTLQTKKATLNDTRSTFNTLRTSLEKFTDAKFGGTFDLFSTNSVKSSNEDIFTATVTAAAKKQSYDVKVQQLATFTKATSAESASNVADDETKLTALGLTEGKLSVFVNGVKHSIEITEDNTLGDLKQKLDDANVKAEIAESGELVISAKNQGDSLDIGATTDTTNFLSLLGLSKQEGGTYRSANSMFKANVSTKLVDENSGFKKQIKEGTFTIGNATFTIKDDTTLSSLISQINNSTEAQANAYWDDSTGKLSITSKKEGASYINIEAGTSNFTDVMGLTQTEYDEEGNITSAKILTNAQELGKNAKLTINGTTITSTSNTITADVSRLDGVTIKLKRESTEEDGTTKLNIEQDMSQLKDAVKSFVDAYNKTLSKIETVTASGADLQRESSLTSFRNTIRNYANGNNDSNGGVYKMLTEIGISTSAADASNLDTNNDKLSFDENKFMNALQNNPESVKSLLAGENGIFAMMENSVEQLLSSSSGFFDIKQSTLDSDIRKQEEKITKKNNYIDTYTEQLKKKFGNMDLMITKMQQSYSSFLSGGA